MLRRTRRPARARGTECARGTRRRYAAHAEPPARSTARLLLGANVCGVCQGGKGLRRVAPPRRTPCAVAWARAAASAVRPSRACARAIGRLCAQLCAGRAKKPMRLACFGLALWPADWRGGGAAILPAAFADLGCSLAVAALAGAALAVAAL
eukprot:2770344-Prymnesium_polylepis.1